MTNAAKPTIPTKTIGFIVNPIAGMGGAVGLKGTDGKTILKQALALGAKPVAAHRAETFLSELSSAKAYLRLVVGAGEMGQIEAEKLGFTCTIVGEFKKETTPSDTQKIALAIVEAHADLLVYCGGDGTTRDIQKAVDFKLPVLGVPTGVKMHSATFAISPQAAARVAIRFLWEGLPLREAEVMDVDEAAFRQGQLSAELYGYMLSPYEPHLIQDNKMASPMTENEVENQAAIAIYIIEKMQPNILYIVGPGTTTRTIADLLDQKKTLLGVDLFLDKKIIASDVNEKQILQALSGRKAQVIVTPIGGQGFIFGRGNQQISAKVIRKVGLDNIIVVATKSKLDRLQSLRVDTGDAELDAMFRARRIRVVTDYKVTQEIAVE
ncbi:MAG: ATP-NAD kinase family protein [Candidatus Bathyarchaeota archaeon]|nr:ATP-NAD kinase family protein [Candidatus Bathyarchaeota archaeon]